MPATSRNINAHHLRQAPPRPHPPGLSVDPALPPFLSMDIISDWESASSGKVHRMVPWVHLQTSAAPPIQRMEREPYLPRRIIVALLRVLFPQRVIHRM